MSIWSSLDGPDIRALNGVSEAANYRAEGDPAVHVDVAVTSVHEHIRLSLWDDGAVDVCALLSPAAAALLRDRLAEALERPRG